VPRFVILEHDHPRLHWDFLLETGGELASWRLLEEPGPGRSVPAEPAPPHRRLYLDYEGPVGGGRGRVARWDAGNFSGDITSSVTLTGSRLRGVARLNPDGEGWRWVFADSVLSPQSSALSPDRPQCGERRDDAGG
jgi:hypothetical protein